MDKPRLGTLYLVPDPLDFHCDTQVTLDWVLPQHTMEVAAGLSYWVCENAKSTRAFLKRVGETHTLTAPLPEQTITELPRHVHKKGDHQSGFDGKPLLGAALQGHDVGLVSEAGMPAVADPGSSLVRAAHDAGVEVIPREFVLDATDVARQPAGFQPRVATPYFGYGYQTWLQPNKTRTFALQGIHGQSMLIQPANQIVIVLTSVNTKPSGQQDMRPYHYRAALWAGVLRSLGGDVGE